MTCGIYRIVNLKNGKSYIGSSAFIEKRWVNHRTTLNRNKHHCQHLQRSWLKHGHEAFAFEILEVTDKLTLSSRELDLMLSIPKHNRFNTSNDTEVPFRGCKHTEKSKELMRQARIGNKASNATREKMSKSQNLRYSTPEGIRARSESAKKLYNDPESRRRHAESQRRWSSTDEARAKNSAAQTAHYAKNPGRADGARQRMIERFSSVANRIEISRSRGGRSVVGLNIATGEAKTYPYLEAIREDGFDPANAKKVINGTSKSHKGWVWMYMIE